MFEPLPLPPLFHLLIFISPAKKPAETILPGYRYASGEKLFRGGGGGGFKRNLGWGGGGEFKGTLARSVLLKPFNSDPV